MGKNDNSTFHEKVAIRRAALEEIKNPVIMETHGGSGKLFERCYIGFKHGVVFEKEEKKAAILGIQRPTWAVYEADCEAAILEGAGAHLAVNFVDVDPYGDPWPTISAFFGSKRPRPEKLVMVVTDGLWHVVARGKSWKASSMQGMVSKYGNNLHGVYLEVCRELMIEKAAQSNYTLSRFNGYRCGSRKRMTHYLAVLTGAAPDT